MAAMLVAAITIGVALWPTPTTEPDPVAEQSSPSVEELAPPPQIADLLLESRNTQPSAWSSLLGLWMVRAEEVDAATAMRCATQPAPGLYCLRGSGNLAKLETLRRPVILRLSSGEREGWGVLLGLTRTRARLSFGGESVDVTRRDLERSWLGEYYALWQAPAFLPPGNLRRGDHGPAIEWLQQRLIRREVLQTAHFPAFYDETMEAAVRSLQAAHGLLPDGIVGPETLLALAADQPGGPRLRTRLE